MTKTSFTKSKTNDRFVGVFPLEFDNDGSKFKESDPAIPDVIHLIPIGQWEHDLYGPIIITSSDIREFVQNFNAGVRKGVFITAGHEGWEELPAVGWISKVEARNDGLWGTVAWNKLGTDTLSDKQYKYFSPELCRDYEDPQTHQLYRNVLTGGALTKSPYFKELEAIVFSEPKLKTKFNENNNTMTKTLEEILAIADISTLTDEDKATLKANADKLTDEQKVQYTSIIDAPAEGEAETDEEKAAREAKEAADKEAADAAAAAEAEATEAAAQNMSEKGNVVISASELAALRAKADQGAQAFKELEKAELDASVSKLTFSQGNKDGKFLPKAGAALRAFMETLNKAQRAKFSDLMATGLPKNQLFTEVGQDGAMDSTAKNELDSKVDAKMKADPKMKYSDALKAVMSENKELAERYNSELPSARKA